MANHAGPRTLLLPPTTTPTPTPTTTPTTTMPTSPESRSRPYKSRSKRPCDFCRRKRAACLLAAAPPCELCARFGQCCTFVERPAKRRRGGGVDGDGEVGGEEMEGEGGRRGSAAVLGTTPESGVSEEGGSEGGFGRRWSAAAAAATATSGIGTGLGGASASVNGQASSGSYMDFEFGEEGSGGGIGGQGVGSTALMDFDFGNPAPIPAPAASYPPAEPPSLDAEASHNAQIVGLSGESDPYLLALYRYDERNECAFRQLRVRNMGVWDGVPVQFMLQANVLACKAQPGEFGRSVDELREEVEGMVGEEPYFPILSRERASLDSEYQPSSFDTCLLAAIYGHALPFTIYDDQLCVEVYTPPSSDKLFNIAWQASLPKFHTPSLSVIQTLLLLLQRRPTNKLVADTPYKWALMAECVALAQALGLNIDPSDWPLPAWEKRLRRRIAWAVYIQDKWLSFNFGRSSHIQMDDWDVRPLEKEDFGSPLSSHDDVDGSEHFLRLASLTGVVARIHSNLL
ncbi:hypothetical protein K490DRAFT_54998 [Saccharata proteae CBS 121410]|uniref:Zn(2)-C6 fungal-type domain-containing protein n=1 Tax=Saccharata proteae CBS 121410 TaxID=1314787 RepID=A0A6A5YD29_9PEZI|nr:hypothetical protein K490DRAFT_54998 [Saccharata proteae CBS 121410]